MSAMLDCYCDYEPAQIYRANIRRARKQHRCDECSGLIVVGEQYEYVFGIWDGMPNSCKTCARCVAIRRFVANNLPCFCWAHGEMLDDARDAIEDAYQRAPDEVRGLAVGYLRLVIARKRHNAETSQSAEGRS